MEYFRDSLKEVGVYAFTFEYGIHICSFTTKFICKPRNRSLLEFKFFFY